MMLKSAFLICAPRRRFFALFVGLLLLLAGQRGVMAQGQVFLPVVTGPVNAAPAFTFAIVSDQREFAGPGQYDTQQYFRGAVEVIRQRGAAYGGVAFVLSPGDLHGADLSRWTIDRVLGPQAPWFPAVGNHDTETAGWMKSLGNYIRALPGRYPSHGFTLGPQECADTTYSFNWGAAHFAVLDLYCGRTDYGSIPTHGRVDAPLYDWLNKDLAAHTGQLLFVVGHTPAYVQGDMDNGRWRQVGASLDADPAMRDRFWKLLKSHAVTAYIVGHTHNFSVVRIGGVWQLDSGHARGAGDAGAPSTVVFVHVADRTVTWDAYRSPSDGSPYTYTAIHHAGQLTGP